MCQGGFRKEAPLSNDGTRARRGRHGAGENGVSPWRVAFAAGAALLAVGVVAMGVYLGLHPVGGTNNAVAAKRPDARASARSSPAPPPLQIGALGTYPAWPAGTLPWRGRLARPDGGRCGSRCGIRSFPT